MFHLTWLPTVAAPPSKNLPRLSISNGQESDESDTEEPEVIDGIDNVGQVLLAEALEEVGEGDDDDGEAQLSVLKAAVWQTPVSMSIAMSKPLCSRSPEAWAYL